MKQKVVTASLIVNSRKIFNGKKIFEFTSWFLKEVFPFIGTHWSLKWRTTSLGQGQPCLSPSILWWYSLSCLWTDVLFPYEMAWLIFELEPWSFLLCVCFVNVNFIDSTMIIAVIHSGEKVNRYLFGFLFSFFFLSFVTDRPFKRRPDITHLQRLWTNLNCGLPNIKISQTFLLSLRYY